MLYLGAKKSLLSAGKTLAAQIAALFASGEQGAWYEPSLAGGTLFQDSAGTTPVTAVGQPVGLMLDKRLGLVLGGEIIPQPLNFASGWVTLGALSSETANSFTNTSGAGAGKSFSLAGLLTTKAYRVSVGYTKSDAVTQIGAFANTASTPFSVATAASGTLSATAYPGANGVFYLRLGGNATVTIDNVSVRELPGNHATQPAAINRPVLQIDGNGKYYLAFNGTNSWMSTAAIDFSGTDKMTVVAGLRKLSDAAIGAVVELSAAPPVNNGAITIQAPYDAATGNYGFGLRGDANFTAFSAAAYSAPTSNAVTAMFDIAGADRSTEVFARVNGVIPSLSARGASPAGGGNFGNYPLYIGARAGSSMFANMNLYGLVVRGALSSDPQIASAERFMNSKTGAY